VDYPAAGGGPGRAPARKVNGMTDVRLQSGDPAPDFTLTTDTGDRLALADLRGHRVVLYAYPAAMTPGCTTQACDFRDSLSSLHKAGFEVVGISPDSPGKLAKFRERDSLTFPLVSDPDHRVLDAYGAWGEKQNYGRTYQGVIRSTFVIDENGRIERAMYNVKATGHVAKLRRELGVD
jgi:thioredoxin-dependent peroxiredoxin